MNDDIREKLDVVAADLAEAYPATLEQARATLAKQHPLPDPVKHRPKITRQYGVDPAAGGYQRLAVRAFRVWCPTCGQLGALRADYRNAAQDQETHARGKPFPVPRVRAG